MREDNWEIFDAIDRAQQLNKSLRPAETIVTTRTAPSSPPPTRDNTRSASTCQPES
ncbi:MAG: hypothetical protein MZV49_07210 [Rhodopseudomonas palustris]|nr:hypothetical protein [Rhodopseudomonas palustris]